MWERGGSQVSLTQGITEAGISHAAMGMLCPLQLYLIAAQYRQEQPGKRRIPLRKPCKSREKKQLQEGWGGTGRKGAWLSLCLRNMAAPGTTRPSLC